MALLDQSLQFSSGQAITATAASTYTYDLETGERLTTTFTPSPPYIDGNATYFGEDLGLGHGKGTPVIQVNTGATAAATGTSLQVQFQGGPMNNTAFASGNLSDITFATYIETPAILTALLTANARIATFDWPKRLIAQALPRFIRLNYVVAGSNFTNLSLTADVSLGTDNAQDTLPQYPANY